MSSWQNPTVFHGKVLLLTRVEADATPGFVQGLAFTMTHTVGFPSKEGARLTTEPLKVFEDEPASRPYEISEALVNATLRQSRGAIWAEVPAQEPKRHPQPHPGVGVAERRGGRRQG